MTIVVSFTLSTPFPSLLSPSPSRPNAIRPYTMYAYTKPTNKHFTLVFCMTDFLHSTLVLFFSAQITPEEVVFNLKNSSLCPLEPLVMDLVRRR